MLFILTFLAATYAHPEQLVDTEWVAAHGADSNVRIVDMRQSGYAEGHVPGAVPLSPVAIRDAKAPPTFLPTPAAFEILMARLGIADTTRVIVYDERGGIYAARLWWILSYFGHPDVAVMNGGWTKWTVEHRATSSDAPSDVAVRTGARFTPRPRPEMVATASDVVAAINKPGVKIVDARTTAEIEGRDLRGIKRGGFIESSVPVYWEDLLDPQTKTFKSAEEIRRVYEARGVLPSHEVIAYCQVGMRASVDLFALHLIGYSKVRNYYGGWEEWGNRDDLPIATRKPAAAAAAGASAPAAPMAPAKSKLQSADLLKLRSVAGVALSPDGAHVAYVVENNDGAGRPYGQVWVMNIADGKSLRLDASGDPVWSPDGQWLAYRGSVGAQAGLVISRADGTNARLIAEVLGTNAPLPGASTSPSWSPDSKRIAFVSSTPGPETADATGDPIVITRYLYKPDASEGLTHFNDNRRLHLFVADIATGKVEQLTAGNHYEHSVDWSPNGEELLFLTNRDADDDEFFNYDVFALKLADKSVRRLTATESNEYHPRWSPDGRMIAFQATRRGLTDRETTMEDTHVWVMNADGSGRRDLGGGVDNRQGVPQWSADGASLLFTVQARGNVRLYRVPVGGGTPEIVVNERGAVGAFSTAKTTIAYSLTTPSDLAQLYVLASGGPPRRMTELNAQVLGGKSLADVEAFTFISNDNRFEVEAFLTKPVDLDPSGLQRYPLVVNIHGGPHGQQGPAFNFRNQVYAARGWATLMVNYRGSTGYGQGFADAVFGDQNGKEGQDVLYGLSSAIRRYPWIDRNRLGVEGTSYGGQLSAWLITQTNLFKAAIPTAAITNIVSYNYMTYYNQYEAMEWGTYPHQGTLMDTLLQRSALRHVANAHTPTMLVHGENDNDVPIAEAEQFYVALKDVGTEAIMVRYPREGHGIREPKHVVDWTERSIAWFEKHFAKPSS